MPVAGAKQVYCLSEKEQRKLEGFIGQGRKNFRLLYSARRDTCSSAAFHQHCDYRGPTVTVIYNIHDTVYGGYTSMSWHQGAGTGVYVSDPSAFLFQLRKDGAFSPKVFKCSIPNDAIFCHPSQGPTFGDGFDLHLMNGTLTPTNDVYTLNGGITFKAYEINEVDKDGFCNNSLDVHEIQVYCITDNTDVDLATAKLLTEPWRSTVDWEKSEETSVNLKQELERYIPLQDDLQGTNARLPSTNILLMGPFGAGKSSFINTVMSTFRGKMFCVARSGCAAKSLTTKFERYPIRSTTSKGPMNFVLYDSRGLEENSLMTRENMKYILQGNVMDKFELEPSGNLNENSPAFKKNPKLSEAIHCVAVFVDASSIDSMNEIMPGVTRNVKEMQSVMNGLGIPQVIILTKIDNVCEKSKEDVSAVYRSQFIGQCVSKVSEMFGLPRNSIFPIKNYEKEGCLNTAVNILTMYTLKMILDHADAYLYNKVDEIVKNYQENPSQGETSDD